MKLQYIVTLGYNDFYFDDGVVALDFARLAKKTYHPDTYHESINVNIEVKVIELDLGENEKED